MSVQLTDVQRQRRNDDGYVQVAVLLLDKGRTPASVAEDQATVYRYAAAFATLGLEKYLRHEQPGYWGLLTSAQLAHLCREVNQTLYPDCAALLVWVQDTFQVSFSRSGLTDLLHRLGFTYKLTTPLPCETNAAAQTAFLTELTGL